METSTPINRKSILGRDLHRRTLIRNALEISPLRRRSLAQTPLVALENVNDEEERSSRRSLIDMQRRLSNIQGTPSLNESSKIFGEKDVKDHFQICTKLFTENKITPKNAWELHIIDLLKHIAQNQGTNTLQVAGTSLDISARVYSIRVDNIHSDGLKLASSMSRVTDKQLPHDLDENVDLEGDADKENPTAKKKKKRKRLLAGEKNTVSKDPKSLEAPLPKLDSVFFSTRIDTESSAIDNLFTNRLKMDNSGYKFMLLTNEKAWTEHPDPVVQGLDTNKRKYPFTVNFLPNVKLCMPFTDFQLDDWDPDEEEKQLALQKSSFMENQQEVMFDEDGVPIHELDGSIHDIFENPPENADDDIQSIQEEVVPQITGEIANIVEFRPDLTDGMQKSEYSYNSVVTSFSGKLIDQIWAGPSHWKLKFIKRTSAKFSGQVATKEKQTRGGKKRSLQEMIDFDIEHEDYNMGKKLKIKKKMATVDVNKFTLPVPDSSCIGLMEHVRELMIKPGVCPVNKKNAPENDVNCEVNTYNYENPNDSQYCSQHSGALNAGDAEPHFDNDDCDEVEEHRFAQQEFLGENLVDAPEIIPKSYVPYALQAKKMDMKKLKAAVWQNLIKSPVNGLRDTQQRTEKVIPTTFSKMYKELPELLPPKMQKELSCPLAFFALLHLCNEQNLLLKQHPGYKDFDIKGS